jgi:hypothetical protein
MKVIGVLFLEDGDGVVEPAGQARELLLTPPLEGELRILARGRRFSSFLFFCSR